MTYNMHIFGMIFCCRNFPCQPFGGEQQELSVADLEAVKGNGHGHHWRSFRFHSAPHPQWS